MLHEMRVLLEVKAFFSSYSFHMSTKKRIESIHIENFVLAQQPNKNITLFIRGC